MRCNAVGAGLDRKHRGAHRIGMPPAARVADGGDVIDVDAEAKGRARGHVVVLFRPGGRNAHQPVTRSAAATTFLARSCEMIALRCLRSYTSRSMVQSVK